MAHWETSAVGRLGRDFFSPVSIWRRSNPMFPVVSLRGDKKEALQFTRGCPGARSDYAPLLLSGINFAEQVVEHFRLADRPH